MSQESPDLKKQFNDAVDKAAFRTKKSFWDMLKLIGTGGYPESKKYDAPKEEKTSQ